MRLKFIIIFVLFLGIGILFQTGALAEDSSTVTATVRTETIGVNVTPSSFDYGIVVPGYDVGVTKTDVISVKNTGTLTETIEVLGDDAVNGSGNIWLLSDSAGTNLYKHSFKIEGGSNTMLHKNSYMRVKSGVVSGDSVSNIDMTLEPPAAGSYVGTFTTTLLFRASI